MNPEPRIDVTRLFKARFFHAVRQDQEEGITYSLESLRAAARGFFGTLHVLTPAEERYLLNCPWPSQNRVPESNEWTL